MSATDKIKNARVSQFRALSVQILITLGIVFVVLIAVLYIYDANIKDAIKAAIVEKAQDKETIRQDEMQLKQHDNITHILSDQLTQHEAITEEISRQNEQHKVLTSGQINVTNSNTEILEAINATVTNEDLEKSVSVKLDDLKRSLDELKETLGLNLTALNETTGRQ